MNGWQIKKTRITRSIHSLAVAANMLLLCSTVLAQSSEQGLDTGVISGRVLDIDNHPVAGARVALCDGMTGYPMVGDARKNVVEQFLQTFKMDFQPVVTVTDDLGQFEFTDIPQQTWRLVAQRSIRKTGDLSAVVLPVDALDECCEEILLLGTAKVELSSEEGEYVELRQAGTGILVVDEHAPNNQTLFFLSTAAPRCDVIMGPVAWGGPFFQEFVGWNRMPKARTIVHGLPEGEVYFALFSLDNNPGFGAGQATIESGRQTIGAAPFVASWSDALHDPPQRLRPLFDTVQQLVAKQDFNIERFLAKSGIPPFPEMANIQVVTQVIDKFDVELELPDGTRTTVADLMAIKLYREMQARIANRK